MKTTLAPFATLSLAVTLGIGAGHVFAHDTSSVDIGKSAQPAQKTFRYMDMVELKRPRAIHDAVIVYRHPRADGVSRQAGKQADIRRPAHHGKPVVIVRSST